MANWKKVVLATGTSSQYIKGDGSFATDTDSLPLTGGQISGNLGIGVSPSSDLHIESASSPTIRLKDTTNNVLLLTYAQNSDAVIGTYSNHPMKFYSNSGLTLTLGTDQLSTFSGNIKIDQGSASSNPRLTFAHDNIGTNHYIEMDRSSDYMKVVVNGGIATIIDSNQSSTFYGAINSSMSSTSVLGNLRNTHASGYGLKIQATDANSARYIATFNDKDDNVKAQIKGDGSATFGGNIVVGDITLSGSTISDNSALTISSGDDITIDATSDINLDADGGDIRFKDNGTSFVTFSSSTGSTFAGSVDSGSWLKINGNNTLWSATNTGTYIQAPATTQTINFRSNGLAIGAVYDAVNKKLGIGGSHTPSHTLHLSATEPYIKLQGTHTDGLYLIGTGDGNLYFTDGSTGVPTMTMDDAFVGIGTASPLHTLHVEKSASSDWIAKFKNTGTTNAYGVQIDTTANTTVGEYSLGVYTGANLGFFVTSDSKASIGTNIPTHRLTVDTVGSGTDMCIGTYSAGKTAGVLYTSADTNGYFAIQSYLSQGSTFGCINLNPSGGNVSIGTAYSAPDPLYITDGASPHAGQSHRMIQLKRNALNDSSNAGADTSAFCSMLFSNRSNGFTIGYGGTSDRFRFLDGGNVERLTIKNGGNVGIGTTNPSAKIHIDEVSNASYYMKLGSSQTEDAFFWYNGSSGDNGYFGGKDQSSGNVNFQIHSDASFNTYFASQGGKVGIGTASPQKQLSVYADGTAPEICWEIAGNSGARNWAWRASGANWGDFQLRQGSSLGGVVDTPRLTILDGGNVGIGTTNPTGYKLVVQGTSEDLLKLHNATDGLDSLISFTNSGGTLARIQGIDNGGLGFDTGNNAGGINTNAMFISNDAKVGIGTLTPSSYNALANNLVVYENSNSGITIASSTNGNGSLFFADGTTGDEAYKGSIEYAHSTNKLMFKANSVTHMGINPNGDVGIGTIDPISLLNLYESNASAVLTIQRREVDGALTTGDIIGQIDFVANDDSVFSGANTLRAQIRANIESSTSATALYFATGNSSTAMSDKMMLSASGNLGIGTTNPTSPASVGKFLNIADTGSAGIVLEDTNAGNWEMYNASGSLYFEDRGNTALALTLKNDKSAIFGGDVSIKTGGGNNDPATLALWSSDVSISANDTIGTILAQGSDSGGSPPYLGGKIEFNADANWDTGTPTYYPTRIDFFTQSNAGADGLASPRMSIDSAGDVNVAGSVDVLGSIIRRNSSGSNNGMAILTTNGNHGILALRNSSGSYQTQINSGGVSYIRGGNVGIGTSSPDSLLSVHSTTTPELGIYYDSGGHANARNWMFRTNHNEYGTFRISYSDDVGGDPRDNDALTINSSGYVGIGTSQPDKTLHLASSDNVLATIESTTTHATVRLIDPDTSNQATLTRVGDNLEIVKDGGNVSIGKDNPAQALDVEGSIISSGVLLAPTYVTFNHSFYDDIGTTAHYLPWGNLAEATGNDSSATSFLVPMSMTLKKLFVRIESITNLGNHNLTVTLIRKADGVITNTTVASATKAFASGNSNKTVTYLESDFSATPRLTQKQLGSLKIQFGSDYGSQTDFFVTSVWQMNNNTL